jgi:cytochrome b561
MSSSPATDSFQLHRIAIGLHWLIAFAIAATFALGLYMHELPLSPQKLKLYSWHKWAGVSIFLFVVLRLGWRLAIARRHCRRRCRPGSAWPPRPRTSCSTC